MIRTVKDYEKLSEQYNKMLEERNTLIDDIDWQQKKIERLEDEKDDMLLEREYYKNRYKDTIRICKELEHENKETNWVTENGFLLSYDVISDRYKQLKQWYQMHKECADAVYEKKVEYESLLSEFSQHIGNKPSSSTYKYFRAKLDNLNITEDK